MFCTGAKSASDAPKYASISPAMNGAQDRRETAGSSVASVPATCSVAGT